jgi:hypothetical protein
MKRGNLTLDARDLTLHRTAASLCEKAVRSLWRRWRQAINPAARPDIGADGIAAAQVLSAIMRSSRSIGADEGDGQAFGRPRGGGKGIARCGAFNDDAPCLRPRPSRAAPRPRRLMRPGRSGEPSTRAKAWLA